MIPVQEQQSVIRVTPQNIQKTTPAFIKNKISEHVCSIRKQPTEYLNK